MLASAVLASTFSFPLASTSTATVPGASSLSCESRLTCNGLAGAVPAMSMVIAGASALLALAIAYLRGRVARPVLATLCRTVLG